MKSAPLGLARDFRSNHAPPKALLVEASDLTLQKPNSFKNALKPQVWCKSMDKKIEALQANRTWNLVPFEPFMNLVGCK